MNRALPRDVTDIFKGSLWLLFTEWSRLRELIIVTATTSQVTVRLAGR